MGTDYDVSQTILEVGTAFIPSICRYERPKTDGMNAVPTDIYRPKTDGMNAVPTDIYKPNTILEIGVH